MRVTATTAFFVFVAWIVSANLNAEETAADLEARGITALKLAQSNPDEIISAAFFFGKAGALYDQSKDEVKATEMNSFLYWCKKKMTLQQMDAFLKGGDAINVAVVTRMKQIDEAPLRIDEAEAYYNRALAFSRAHPTEHLLIAIRLFEVADRFKGTEISFQAQDKSLKEMTLAQTSNEIPTTKKNPASAEPDLKKKLPTPTKAQIKEAEQKIKDIYREEFAKQDLQSVAILANKLNDSAGKTADGADKFVLYLQSGLLAAKCANTDLIISIFDNVEASFFEDGVTQIKNEILGLLARSAKEPKILKWASAMRTLVDKPDDPLANVVVGMYLANQENQWQRALQAFKKGNESTLKAASDQELKVPVTAQERMEAADLWLEAATKHSQDEFMKHAKSRAKHWYLLALPQLDGLNKAKVEKRLAELLTTVNLLKLVDLNKDAVSGKWTFKNNSLVCDATHFSRLQFPYKPPEEYDFKLSFEKQAGNDSVFQILAARNTQWVWTMGAEGHAAGFDLVDGRGWGQNQTQISLKLENHRLYTVVISVRRTYVSIVLDGSLVKKFDTDFSNLSIWQGYKLNNMEVLGIGSTEVTMFKSADLVEISGEGKLIRK